MSAVGEIVASEEELAALPRGAVVVIEDAEGSTAAIKDVGCWYTVGMHSSTSSADLWDLSIDPEEGGPTPVILVHLPGSPPRPERLVRGEALKDYAHTCARAARGCTGSPRLRAQYLDMEQTARDAAILAEAGKPL